jgi:hypothetical protein
MLGRAVSALFGNPMQLEFIRRLSELADFAPH